MTVSAAGAAVPRMPRRTVEVTYTRTVTNDDTSSRQRATFLDVALKRAHTR